MRHKLWLRVVDTWAWLRLECTVPELASIATSLPGGGVESV